MDPLALRAGNTLLGNEENAAAIEVQMFPFRVRFLADTWIALTGADCRARLDGAALPAWWGCAVRKGQQLELRFPRRGARGYLCVAGGIDVPQGLGSRSTALRGGFGGLEGRPLQRGDVLLAKARGVGIGAHPGLPDRQGFGRKEMAFSADEICQQVVYQLGALSAIARAEGTRVAHLSFHAAMGNMINRDDALALQVMQTVARIDSQLILFCQPDTIIERAAQAAGLPTLTLFLADRAYDDRGQLVPRGIPGSLIKEETAVRARVRQFLQQGTVTTFSGNTLPVRARSILPRVALR